MSVLGSVLVSVLAVYWVLVVCVCVAVGVGLNTFLGHGAYCGRITCLKSNCWFLYPQITGGGSGSYLWVTQMRSTSEASTGSFGHLVPK